MSIDAEPLETTVLDSEPAEPGRRPPAEPVVAAERVAAVDVLRGFALLGILAMNIVDFAWPGQAYMRPTAGGGFQWSDRLVWIVNHLVFEAKMMTIFSMLFGAGLVLMGDRADARGRSLAGVYYRRVLWLIVIGLLHAYFLWSGDILVLYGECGLILYLFRRRSPRTLLIVGTAAVLVFVPVLLALVAAGDFMKAEAARAEVAIRAGQTPTRFQGWSRAGSAWLQRKMTPDPERQKKDFDEALKTYRGPYWGMVKDRAKGLWIGHTIGFFLGGFWMAGGRMLIGMGLMKLGVFSAERPRRFYRTLMLLGYGIGLPLVAYDAYALIARDFSVEYMMRGGIFYNYIGSILVALGHVGAIMLIMQAGALAWLTRRLAAVGRMALSNYLMHTIIGTTLFYGYGFGLFGTINRTGLAGIVLAIWAFQLWLSPIWLAHFRFGPAEWAWRSLTYWRLQPFRAPAVTGLAPGVA